MPDANQPKWESIILLISAVVGAMATVLALLPIPQLHPLFSFFGLNLPLWMVLAAVVLAACVPGILFKRKVRRAQTERIDDSEIKKRCGLTIQSWTLIEESKPNQYMLKGHYDNLPPRGMKVWLIVASPDRKRYWPQSEVNPDKARNEWNGRVGLGSGTRKDEKMRVILAILGDCDQLLSNYYLQVVDRNRPDHNLPLTELPGMIECASELLDKRQSLPLAL